MRDVVDYEGLYAITDDGQVWSHYVQRWLKVHRNRYGHYAVVLQKNGQRKHTFVHRLVLEAFVGPCPDGMECRHLDGNPANNKLENLCWGTPQENAIDRIRHGVQQRGARHGRSKLNDEQVREIRKLLADGVPQRKLARKFNVSKFAISSIHSRQTWRHI